MQGLLRHLKWQSNSDARTSKSESRQGMENELGHENISAKEAIFRAMGWAEDKKDLPGQMFFQGFEPQKKSRIIQPSLQGLAKPRNKPGGAAGIAGMPGGAGSTDKPMTLAEHAKVCEAKTPQRCPYARKAAEELAAKPENQGRAMEDLLNEVWSQHQELKVKGDEEQNPEESTEEGAPKGEATPTEPGTVNVGGKELPVKTDEDEKLAGALNELLTSKDAPPDKKEKAQEVLPKLEEKLENAGAGETHPEEEEIEGVGPVTDEEYAELLKDSDFAAKIDEFKQKVRDTILQGRNLDALALEKGSPEERALNEVVAELQAQGVKFRDEMAAPEEKPTEEEAKPSEEAPKEEPEEETKEEPANEPVKEEGAESGEKAETQTPEEAPQQEGKTEVGGEQRLTMSQQEALKELADRFKASIDGIKKNVSDDKFQQLLNNMAHFSRVKQVWASDGIKEPSRLNGREAITEVITKNENKSFNDLTIDTISQLLKMDHPLLTDSLKFSLQDIQDRMADMESTAREIRQAHTEFRRLDEKYGLTDLLRGDIEEEPADTEYLEDGDENHKKGLPTTSDESEKTYSVNISGIPDIETHNGSLSNVKEISEKMAKDIADKLGISVDSEDIKKTPLMAMTEFTFAVPEEKTLSQAQGNAVCEAIKARFPLKNIKKGSETAPQKATYSFDAGTQTFKVSVENEKKGAYSQKKLLESKEFKDAVAAGGVPILLGIDANQKPIIRDLKEMIHTLMVGVSGAGKSVMLNDIITGLLSQSPYNVRLGLVDLAGVELPKYDGSKHMIMPTATTGEAADKLISWYSNEMQARKKLFQQAKVKDLAQYNRLGEEGGLPEGLPKHLPYLPLIIDEFSDLLDEPQKNSITQKLSKMAREARKFGVHMFIATQKGTTDFIPSPVSSQASTRIGLAQSDSVNAKRFGTPDAVNIPTYSGGFQMKIGNALVNGTSGILPDEGYDEIAKRFSFPSEAPAPTGGEGKTPSKTGKEGTTPETPSKPTPSGEAGGEGKKEAPSGETPASGEKAEPPVAEPEKNPFLDEAEINSIPSEVGKKEVTRAASDFQKAYKEYLTALDKGKNIDAAKAKYGMEFEKYNQTREENGLPPVERTTGKPKPQEETPAEETASPEASEPEAKENTDEKSISGEEPKSDATEPKKPRRAEYLAKYPQTREGQLQKMEDALNDKFEELADRGIRESQIEYHKEYRNLRDMLQAEIDEKYPEKGKKTPEEEDTEVKEEVSETGTPSGATEEVKIEERETSEPKDTQGVSGGNPQKYDTSHMTDEEKFEFETELAHHDAAVQKIKDQYREGKIKRDEYRKQMSAANKSFDAIKAEYGLAEAPKEQEKTETPSKTTAEEKAETPKAPVEKAETPKPPKKNEATKDTPKAQPAPVEQPSKAEGTSAKPTKATTQGQSSEGKKGQVSESEKARTEKKDPEVKKQKPKEPTSKTAKKTEEKTKKEPSATPPQAPDTPPATSADMPQPPVGPSQTPPPPPTKPREEEDDPSAADKIIAEIKSLAQKDPNLRNLHKARKTAEKKGKNSKEYQKANKAFITAYNAFLDAELKKRNRTMADIAKRKN